MQPLLQIITTDDQEYEIECFINTERVKFILYPDRYPFVLRRVHYYIEQEWFNKAISMLMAESSHVQKPVDMIYDPFARRPSHAPKEKPVTSRLPEPTEFSKTPSAEYSFTLIAPTAKNGLIYQGQRYWHKTSEAAMEYAKYIYDANPTEKFELTVVKAIQNIRPKPQIELETTDFIK